MRYWIRAWLKQRSFDVEVTVPGKEGPLIVRNLPERALDSFVQANVELGRSVTILRSY